MAGTPRQGSARAAEESQWSQSLAGPWRVALTHATDSVCDADPPTDFPESIRLPATTETACLGPLNDQCRTSGLTPVRRYVGAAWYAREFDIPETWAGRVIFLHLERTKATTVWLDGARVGERELLCTPQQFSLGELAAGNHRLVVLVDNRRFNVPGDNHQTSEHTQGNWNGILGVIELRARPRTFIAAINVVPDLQRNEFRLRVALGGDVPLEGGELEVESESYNHAGRVHRPDVVKTSVAAAQSEATLTLPLGAAAQRWDEFSPALYRLKVTLHTPHGDEVRELTTGLRAFTTTGTQFAINGRRTFLRGEVNCGVFPLTGHPPFNVEGWRSYYRTLLEHGINHVRFHSWTPPAAAFTAADELGVYVQTELPFWGEWNDEIARALQTEGEAILREFGHHPSFVMLALGNEHRGERRPMTELVATLRSQDPHRLYAEGSNNFLENPTLAEADDFWVTARVPSRFGGCLANVRAAFASNDGANGHLQTGPANTCVDYSAAIAGIRVPVISHEIGQFTVTPQFAEIERYTGVFRARNLEHFKARLAATGRLDQANACFEASAKLAAICYREEIEAALRTPGFGGFQLLGLQDFPGQGTALVGLLDAFMTSKAAIAPAVFRRFCGPRVLLAKFPRYIWSSGEMFTAEVNIADYASHPLGRDTLRWSLERADGIPLAAGEFATGDLAQNGVHRVGEITALVKSADAVKLTLRLRLNAAGIENDYPLWLFPARSAETDPTTAEPTRSVKLVRHFDDATRASLEAGGTMVLMPDAAHPFAHSPGGGFTTDFWCWPMFFNTPGTMGLLIEPAHPALAGFPTATHSDWQWFNLARASQPVVLDELPDLAAAVEAIDNLERVHRLGIIFEARLGAGRLLVCAVDLPELAREHPEARHLLNGLLSYAASARFDPQVAVRADRLSHALEARIPLLHADVSASSPRPNRDPFRTAQSAPSPLFPAAGPRSKGGAEEWQITFPAFVALRAVELAWDKEPVGYHAIVEIIRDDGTWRTLAESDADQRHARSRYHRIECATRQVRGVRVKVRGLVPSDAGLGELRLIQPGA